MNMMKETKRNSLQVVCTLYGTAVTMILIQLLLHIKRTESTSTIALPGCQDSCGGISIPYPFGIGLNCSRNHKYLVTCHTTYNNATPTPYLSSPAIYNNDTPTPYPVFFPIVNISLPLGQARVGSIVGSRCYNTTTKKVDYNIVGFNFGELFWLNTEKNKFTVIGCNTLAYLGLGLSSNSSSVGCLSSCDSLQILEKYGSCSGIGCCKTAIPEETSDIKVWFEMRNNNLEVFNFSHCSYATVVEEAAFKFQTSYITNDELSAYVLPNFASVGQLPVYESSSLPVLINWVIEDTTCDIAQTNKSSYPCKSDHSICLTVNSHGYICNCSDGYEGNPYLDGGCQDINECANRNPCSTPANCHNLEGAYRCSCPFGWRSNHNDPTKCDLNIALPIGIAAGIVALLFLGILIYMLHQRRNLSKVKEKYFQQYGGWILLENIRLNQGFGFTIFTKQQVEQATNNFDTTNILGQGGHGTVYRGTLRDKTVAIKKCKIINERKKKEFGKEMLILSQINHKNIVKILGCCLEVEVPILVYELIRNGTLYHYIHSKKQGSHISLETRLRIAHESAEALAYLHTSASPPIIHGDIKSANILLDQNYTAKVSDFGASILVPTDKAQFVTLVQGTYGYLDPEYMQTGQLTDKSDVYSFGVVLMELLTSKPVIDFDAPEEMRNLSARFLSAMEDNKMQELLDDEIYHEDDMKLIKEVAELAKECLSIKGGERPTMKEVAEELLRLSKVKQHSWGQEYNPEETETLLISERSQHAIKHTSNYFNIDEEAEESIAIGR